MGLPVESAVDEETQPPDRLALMSNFLLPLELPLLGGEDAMQATDIPLTPCPRPPTGKTGIHPHCPSRRSTRRSPSIAPPADTVSPNGLLRLQETKGQECEITVSCSGRPNEPIHQSGYLRLPGWLVSPVSQPWLAYYQRWPRGRPSGRTRYQNTGSPPNCI